MLRILYTKEVLSIFMSMLQRKRYVFALSVPSSVHPSFCLVPLVSLSLRKTTERILITATNRLKMITFWAKLEQGQARIIRQNIRIDIT